MSTILIAVVSGSSIILGGIVTTVLKFVLDKRHISLRRSLDPENLASHKLFEKFAFYYDHIAKMSFGDDGRTLLVQFILQCFVSNSSKSWNAFVKMDRSFMHLETIHFNVLEMYQASIDNWKRDCLDEGVPPNIFAKFERWFTPYQRVFVNTVYHISRHAVFPTVDSKLAQIMDSITFNLDLFVMNADVNLKNINGDLDGIVFHGVRIAFRAFKGQKEIVFVKIRDLCDKYQGIASFAILDCPETVTELPVLYVSDSLCARTGYSAKDILNTKMKNIGVHLTPEVLEAMRQRSSYDYSLPLVCSDKMACNSHAFLLPILSNEDSMFYLFVASDESLKEIDYPMYRDFLSTLFNREDPVMICWLDDSLDVVDIKFISAIAASNRKLNVGKPFVYLLKPDSDRNAFVCDTILHNASDLPFPMELQTEVNFGRACVNCELVVYKFAGSKKSAFTVLIFPLWGGKDLFSNSVTVGEIQMVVRESY